FYTRPHDKERGWGVRPLQRRKHRGGVIRAGAIVERERDAFLGSARVDDVGCWMNLGSAAQIGRLGTANPLSAVRTWGRRGPRGACRGPCQWARVCAVRGTASPEAYEEHCCQYNTQRRSGKRPHGDASLYQQPLLLVPLQVCVTSITANLKSTTHSGGPSMSR